MIWSNFNQIIIKHLAFTKSLVTNKHLTIWQRCHLQRCYLQNTFSQWKSTTLRWIYFLTPNKIKVVGWKLTIYDGGMIQSNESSGIIIPRIKRSGVLEHGTIVFSSNWSDDPRKETSINFIILKLTTIMQG